MHVKTVVSAIALSAAMLVSGAAVGQTMVGGMEVSAEDLPAVQERCTQLVTAADTESLTTDADDTEDSNDPNSAPNETEGDDASDATATVEDAPEVNEAANATSKIDLDTITLEMCTEAGLGGAM